MRPDAFGIGLLVGLDAVSVVEEVDGLADSPAEMEVHCARDASSSSPIHSPRA